MHDFVALGSSLMPYFCSSCLANIFLFQSLDNAELRTVLSKSMNISTFSSNIFSTFNSNQNQYCSIKECSTVFHDSKNFMIMYVNTRSLHKKFEKLEELIHEINISPDVIAISETKLKDNTSFSYSFFGYDFASSIAASVIASPLTNLFNHCIETGTYPDAFKTAEVIPVYKSGDKFTCSNFRPISLISPFSKIFEKCIYKQLYHYFTSRDILYKHQHGFRENHSTELAVSHLCDSIIENLEKKTQPVLYSWIWPRRSILKITKFCYLNFMLMVFVEYHLN